MNIEKKEQQLKRAFEANIARTTEDIDKATTDIERMQNEIRVLQQNIKEKQNDINELIEKKASLLTEYNEFIQTID